MLCLFCNKSVLKNNAVDDEMEKGTTSFCFTCFILSIAAHLPDKDVYEQCFAWYSIKHHKLLCPGKSQEQNLFIPKIDQDLLPRFLDILHFDEKYSMILSSLTTLKNIKFNPIKTVNSLIIRGFNSTEQYSTSDITIVTDSVRLSYSDMVKNMKLFDLITSKAIICIAKNLLIEKANFSPQILLQLLTPYTKVFSCYYSSCNPKLSFSDIIKRAPNLEHICIEDPETNIVFDKTWVKDLVEYKNGNNFTYLYVDLQVIELDVENMAKFVRNQLITNDQTEKAWKKLNELKVQLTQHFEYLNKEVDERDEIPSLTISFKSSDLSEEISLKTCQE